jgi:magnesium chelatase family protein
MTRSTPQGESMSLAVIHSRALDGLAAPEVTVEVHLANGLPSFTLVGLADTEVKESRERVRAALQNSGLEFPHNKRITVNLAPADLPKESGRFDLPIALGILAASGQIDAQRLAALRVRRRADAGRRLAAGAWRARDGAGGAPPWRRRTGTGAGAVARQRQRGGAGRRAGDSWRRSLAGRRALAAAARIQRCATAASCHAGGR